MFGHFSALWMKRLKVNPNVNFELFALDLGCNSNVHQMLRRSPERLLNVLFTFDLRPVSKGLLLPLHVSTHPKLKVQNTFVWLPDRHIAVLGKVNLNRVEKKLFITDKLNMLEKSKVYYTSKLKQDNWNFW